MSKTTTSSAAALKLAIRNAERTLAALETKTAKTAKRSAAAPVLEALARRYTVGKCYPTHLLTNVEGATKVVLSSSDTLFWYDAAGTELAKRKATDAAALRAQYGVVFKKGKA